jgi:histidyl-tRNA synthetase
VIGALGERSLKAQLRQADSLGSMYTAILGDQELKSGGVTLRDMSTGEQQNVSVETVGKLFDQIHTYHSLKR